MAEGRVRVGTSGWVYGHWRGTFYPEDLPLRERLAYYAERLRTVEVNNTYYRLPSAPALATWRETVGEGFTFAFKAHRAITHRKRLLDAQEPLGLFLDGLRPVEDMTDVVLFQLPPFMAFDAERLDDFLATLPEDKPYRYAFEFRHPSWTNEQTLEILGLYGVAFCIHDFEQEPPLEVTTDAVYVRFHGPTVPYRGLYDDETMAEWTDRIRAWQAEGRDVWAYFNNDERAYAARNAIDLRARLAHTGIGKASKTPTTRSPSASTSR